MVTVWVVSSKWSTWPFDHVINSRRNARIAQGHGGSGLLMAVKLATDRTSTQSSHGLGK